jgi:tRNA threonylcarbamoyladenosine biosynthesis protein TsaE
MRPRSASANGGHAASVDAFEELAAAFARELRPGDVVALEGPLGSGKTTFVAAVVRALGNSSHVTSPTFTFRHHYEGTPPVEHLDLFRLEDPAEAAQLGLEEAFGADRIVLVEWPERLPGLRPAHAIRLRIAGAGDGPREIAVTRPAGRGANG